MGDERLHKDGEDPSDLISQVRASGQRLSAFAGDLASYSEALHRKARAARPRDREDSLKAPSRKVRNGIIISMCVSLVIVLAFCITISVRWGDSRLAQEADRYEDQLTQWLTQQQSILYMFTDVISSHPDLMADYDSAVNWLGDIARKYPDISLCYMANPYAEHPVVMSNGWVRITGRRPGPGTGPRNAPPRASAFPRLTWTPRAATTASPCPGSLTGIRTSSWAYSALTFSWTS